ncbi:hypothetical protein [Nocardioides litoris]|uniref:hypothetical protein n=1 Tax=Nocardioides litoris TaxID=1926648 RepID=UPI00111E416D|nr:hypothetical protein [Nocardioides litoris]
MTEQPHRLRAVPDDQAVLAAAAAEDGRAATTPAEAAAMADRYDRMGRLAALFDESAEQVRHQAGLGSDVATDPAFTDSRPLSPATWDQAEEDLRGTTSGKRGLLNRSIELDADALVLRATVLTYRWIDELQTAAYKTLGSIAGRAIGYLAPEVALGGAIVSAGLIETDALDRDGVAAYLDELAGANPELLEHVTSGGGGLLDGLRMRSLLTTGVLAGDRGRQAAQGGLRALGVDPLVQDLGPALRDVAGGLVDDDGDPAEGGAGVEGADGTAAGGAPRSLADLLTELSRTTATVTVRRVGDHRFVAFLPGPDGAVPRRLRLVGGDQSSYAAQVVRTIERAVAGVTDPRVMLVGVGQGGVAAAEVAAQEGGARFTVDQVVTAGAPSAHVPRIPEPTRVLALEDRSDPVALLGSLIGGTGAPNRVTVVYDGGHEGYVDGGRAADAADHPALREELARLVDLGYLAG